MEGITNRLPESAIRWRNILKGRKMIFVILGTQKFQLNRLLQEMDELVGSGRISEEVFAQTGHSDYQPKHYSFVDFLDKPEFEKKIKESSLVITHSGVGSIITAIQSQKPVIVYPRLVKYNEHVDDHQLEIAEAFKKKNFVLCCDEKEDLEDLIAEAKTHSFDVYHSSTAQMLQVVGKFLGRNNG